MARHIAIVTAVYAPVVGGMSTVATHEARAVMKISDATVFTLSYAGESPEPNVVRLTAWPRISFGGFVPQMLWRLWNFDTVYAHLPAYGCMAPLLLWKLLRRRRLVITVHMDPRGTGWRRVAFALARPLMRALIRCADAVRISSDALAHRSLLGGAKNVQIIPFGVDTAWWHPDVAWSDRHNVLLFVGRLSRTHYFKGVDVLLRAFVHVKPPTRLWIVGDGDLRASYESLAAELGIADRVDFLGTLSDTALRLRYQRARALVLPSTDQSETFGMVLIEAMACGCPVIASKLAGVMRVVPAQGGTLVTAGTVSELATALHQAVTLDNAVGTAHSNGARAHACGYGDWNVIAERVVHLL